MERVWHISSKVLSGLFLAAMYATPQGYTISARPGAVNYIEGHALLNGTEISQKTLGKTFLNTNDTLSTDVGKAEVLLTPGVFLRIGDNSQIRMVSPTLTDTQVEVIKGEAMVEIADLGKGNSIEILDRGGSMQLEKPGLYRITADDPPTAAVLEGKAELSYGDHKVGLGKGHEAVITADLKAEKFNTKKEDDLYAWSNVRSEYDAGASYASARTVTSNSYNNTYGGWAGYPGGLGNGFGGPGWFYNGMWDSWAWLPGNNYFFSPFGWGFYSPAYIRYAPVIYAPVGGRTAPVPVNTNKPPAIAAAGATAPRSPAALSAARAQTARSFAVAQARQSGAATQAGQSGSRISAPSSAGRTGGFSAPSAAPSAASSAGAHSSGGGSHR
jgi:hypothetical protein